MTNSKQGKSFFNLHIKNIGSGKRQLFYFFRMIIQTDSEWKPRRFA